MKIFFLTFCFTILSFFSGHLTGNAYLNGQDYALLIAIDSYEHWSSLNNPIKDAESIARELTDIYGYQVEILRNSSKIDIFSKLEEYRKKTYEEDAQLFIFLSGHGEFIEGTSEGFFIPTEGLSEDPFGVSFIPHSRIERAIDNIPCRHILLAIDACYSGTFDESIALMKGERKRPGETAQVNKEVFIRRTLRVNSRLYITSGGKERTPDGVTHSPFTEKFLAALGSYGGGDDILSYYELLSYMEHAVPTPRTGQFGAHQINGSFLFIVRNKDYLFQNTEDQIDNEPEKVKTDVATKEVFPALNDNELSLVETGIQAMKDNDVDEAQKIFLNLRARKANSYLIYEALYKIYIETNEQMAYQYLNEGLERYPNNTTLVFLGINHNLKRKNYNELPNRLKLAISLEPDNIPLYRTLASVYDELYQKKAKAGDNAKAKEYFDLALQYYTQSIEKDENYVDALYGIGVLYYNKAAAETVILNQLADDFSKAGTAKYEAKKKEVEALFDQALPYFKRLERLNPNDINTLTALIEIYARKDDLYTSNEFKERLNKVQSGEKNESSFFEN